MAKNFRETINSELKSFLKKDRNRDVSITKADFLEYLDIIRTDLNTFSEIVGGVNQSEFVKFSSLVKMIDETKSVQVKMYRTYVKYLSTPGKNMEKNNIFSTLIMGVNKSEQTLGKIVDLYSSTTKKLITPSNLKLGDVAVMGAVVAIDDIAQTAKLLFTGVISAVTRPSGRTPQYRVSYLESHVEPVATDISRIINGEGLMTFKDKYGKISANNNNINLVDSSFNPSAQFIGYYVPDFVGNILTGIMNLNIFRYLGETVLLYKHSIYKKQEDERAWLINHVNALKLEVSNDNMSKAQKAKLLDIISAYDARIAKLDRDIAKYRGE